jgi:hypothetical protein
MNTWVGRVVLMAEMRNACTLVSTLDETTWGEFMWFRIEASDWLLLRR